MIQKALQTLEKLFDLDVLEETAITQKDITDYYSINQRAYSIIHHQKYIHMGLTEQGKKFSTKDFEKPLEYIAGYITSETKNVLELACGRGANAEWLAKNFPAIAVTGIDLSEKQLSYASNKQVTYIQGDYHDLAQFDDATFEMVYVIEALCHSPHKQDVFSEVKRVLKPEGVFIVIDGYASKNKQYFSADEQKALLLTAKGMCVETVEEYAIVKEYAERMGFMCEKEWNVSQQVLPSMERIKRRISRLGNWGVISRFIFKIFPMKVKYNYISGYLMPLLMREKITSYMISIFRK